MGDRLWISPKQRNIFYQRTNIMVGNASFLARFSWTHNKWIWMNEPVEKFIKIIQMPQTLAIFTQWNKLLRRQEMEIFRFSISLHFSSFGFFALKPTPNSLISSHLSASKVLCQYNGKSGCQLELLMHHYARGNQL